VCVVLSADALSSHKPEIDASRDDRKSRFDDSFVQGTRKTQRCKTVPSNALRKRSRGTKVDIDHVLAVPTARDGSLSTAGFDSSEWEIMYPLFVAEGLIDTFAHVSRRET
jgi:hypothetical protein